MPRRARLSIAGIPWHIIQRGNNRSACFFHPYLSKGGSPSQAFTFRHEFRHLMPENNQLYDRDSYLRDYLRGNISQLPIEKDADEFARSTAQQIEQIGDRPRFQ